MPYDLSRYTLTPAQQQSVQAIRALPVKSVWGDEAEHQAWNEAIRLDQNNRSKASHNRLVRFGQIASLAPFAVAGGAALLGGGAAASGGAAGAAGAAGTGVAGAGAGAGVSSAAGAGGLYTLGNLSKFAQVAVPAVTSYLGQRSQNKALDRQAQIEQQNLQQQMAYAREIEAQRRAEADRLYGEEQRRWDVDQQNRARELAASDEERAFTRRLIEEREGRRQQARVRLSDFLGRGRG